MKGARWLVLPCVVCVLPQIAVGQAAPGVAAPDGLGDIVVTALKREERLQDTPSAVSVVTSQDLLDRGVTDIRGVANLAPSVQLSAENTATQVFIRGIGQSSDGDSNSPAVAVNFDGVYTPRYAVGTSMFDVARIEILPGPKGLLYGRNAAGGAINVLSRTPGERFSTNGLLEIGDYGLFHASGGAAAICRIGRCTLALDRREGEAQ